MDTAAVALIAHDLKNALGALESELATLSEQPSINLAQRAHRHCVDLRQRVVQFLMVYCSQDGLHAHCEDESPHELLNSLLRAGRQSARNQGAHCSLHLGPCNSAPPFWYLDRRLVGVAMEAALNNAIRYARGQVTLDARLEDSQLVLVVDDDGPGLGGSKDATPGHTPAVSTGLGTSLCWAVAEAHVHAGRQGQIRLSNRPAGGARFELWLP